MTDESEHLRLHRYDTAVPLSAGGAAEVFTAHDPQVGRDVALKFPRSDDPAQLQRILDEARLLAQLDHPNVCRIYDVGELEGRPYLALELVDGEPLDAVCDRLDLRARIALIADVAEAVHAAHEAGILHRDLKPDNVLVARTARGDLRPVVVDFGLARTGSAGGDAPIHSVLSGTPPYLAPELIRHPERPADRRSDVYALGAILYRAIAGVPVFDATSHVELLRRTLEDAPRRPSARGIDPARTFGHRDLDVITLGCLAKDPARRYASAQTVAEALRDVLDGQRVRDHLRSGDGRRLFPRATPRHLVAVTLALAIAIAVIAVAIGRQLAVERRHARAFAEQAHAMSDHMRTERKRAADDLGPAKQHVGQSLAALIAQLDDLPRAALGPAHAAIGHGQLAIDRPEDALDHLERAWALGHRSPDVAYDLALARSHRYARALDAARAAVDPTLQHAAVEATHRHHRQPLLDALDAARDAPSVPVGYVEAQLALHTERFDAALVAAERARQQVPWLHETDLLRGQVLLRQGESFALRGAFSEAEAAYAAAADAYADALASAPGEPKAHVGLCAIERACMRMTVQREQVEALDAHRQRVARHCNAAIALDARPIAPYLMNAETAILWAGHRFPRGNRAVRSDALDHAMRQLDRAAAIDPDDPRVAWLQGDAFYQRARLISWWRREGDPRPWIERAVVAHRRALRHLPDHPLLLARIGEAYGDHALYAAFSGADPTLAVRLGAGAMRRVLATHRDVLAVHRAIAELYGTDAFYRMRSGRSFIDATRRSIHHHRRTVRLDSDSAEAYASLGLMIGLHLRHNLYSGLHYAAQRQESIAMIARAIALRPDKGEYHDDMIQAVLNAARADVARGEDPSAMLARGREALERLLESAEFHDPVAAHMRGLDLEVLTLQWLLQQPDGADASIDGALMRARAHHAVVSAVTTNFFVIRALVDFELIDARIQLLRGTPRARARAALDAAEARIARLLTLRPDDARMLVRRGIVARLRADAADGTSAQRTADLQRATESWERALALNRWTALEIAPWRDGLVAGDAS
ncbi:MAG: serine/threonine-protein kinase [Acidobacteriota bacterium]